MPNAVIIGASSGIGKALAQLLLSENYHVFNFSRKNPELTGVIHTHYDVLNAAENTFEGLPEEVHALVYCPGSIQLKPFARLSLYDFQQDYQINVAGAIKVTQSLISRLKKGKGAVVYFSTVAVQTGMSFHTSVAAAKGALEGLTRALAAEFAPQGVRFNCIAPSLTATPLAAQLLSTPEKIEASAKRHPLGRVGQPEDLAALAAFLVSEKSSWMSGQIIHADGGMGSLK